MPSSPSYAPFSAASSTLTPTEIPTSGIDARAESELPTNAPYARVQQTTAPPVHSPSAEATDSQNNSSLSIPTSVPSSTSSSAATDLSSMPTEYPRSSPSETSNTTNLATRLPTTVSLAALSSVPTGAASILTPASTAPSTRFSQNDSIVFMTELPTVGLTQFIRALRQPHFQLSHHSP